VAACVVDAWPGDIVEEPVEAVEVYVRVSDPDETDKIAKIELFEDGKVVEVDEPNKQGPHHGIAGSPGVRYGRVRTVSR
jgi:hypothetical protein